MSTCKIVGKLIRGSGIPVIGSYIYATCYDSPAIIQDTSTGIVSDPIRIYSTSTGQFELELERNVKFTIYIPEMGFKRTVLVPDSEGPINLWGLTDVFVTGDATPNDTNEDNW